MATKVVEKSKVVDISKTQKTKKASTTDKTPSKASALIVATLILFIFSYIAVDYFVVNHKIDNKITIVNQKFDSLEVYLGTKLPQINRALQIQEQQVKDLQNLTSSQTKNDHY